MTIASSTIASLAVLVACPAELKEALDGLKKTDLAAIAKELGLSGTARLKKAELAGVIADELERAGGQPNHGADSDNATTAEDDVDLNDAASNSNVTVHEETLVPNEATLKAMKKDALVELAKGLGLGNLSRLRKSELLDVVTAELAHTKEVVGQGTGEEAVTSEETSANDEASAIVTETVDAEEADVDEEIVPVSEPDTTSEPEAALEVTPEPVATSDAGDQADVPASAAEDAIHCANVYAQVAGVVSLDDLWELYQLHYPSAYPRKDFNHLLSGNAVKDAVFRVWFFEGGTYVALDELFDGDEDPWVYMAATTESSTETEWFRRFAARRHRVFPIKLVEGDLGEYDPMADILGLPAVQALTEFIGVRAVAAVAKDLMERLISLGRQEESEKKLVDACLNADIALDGVSDHDELRRLVHAMNATLPHWVHNGWSPREIEEKLVGRARFKVTA